MGLDYTATYNTNPPTNRNCLQHGLSRQCSLKSPMEKKRVGCQKICNNVLPA